MREPWRGALKAASCGWGAQATGRVCIGTVKGDLHDIVKNLVKMMIEGKGLEVIDLETDVPPEKFISTAIEQDCQIIALSALLTTTMPVMGEDVEAAKDAGIETIMNVSETCSDQLSAICIAGGFGGHINFSNAVRIGLLPEEFENRMCFIGNGAFAGAEKILLDRGCLTEMRRLAEEAVTVNLGGNTIFNECFVDHLYFDSFTANLE